MKFSSFKANEKEYTVDVDPELKVASLKDFPPFKAKKEVTHEGMPFDENTRLRLPKMPIKLQYEGLLGRAPEPEAQSCYCAVNYKGHTYHLFNAKRMPVGRMAVLIS